MIVLAGVGHIAYGSGIPKRAARRNSFDYATVLNDAEVEKGIADFLVFPGTVPGGKSPLLMVHLKTRSGTVIVEGFPENSVSKKAGMKVGDVILAIDHLPVHDVEDVKAELAAKAKGDEITVRVSRKGVFGSRDVEIPVVLQ